MSIFVGIDVGEVRIGISISDEKKKIAFPLSVIDIEKGSYGFKRIDKLLKKHGIFIDDDVSLFVVGLPKRSDGKLGDEEQKVLNYIESLKKYFKKDVVSWDERYTTVIATKSFQESNHSKNKLKRNIDKIAAQIILQSYLDHINR